MRRLCYDERCFIEHMLNSKKSVRDIALFLKRPYITIFREIKRNSVENVYDSKVAQRLTNMRQRQITNALKFTDEHKRVIEEKLIEKFSFEQIESFLKKERPDLSASFATMYRWHKKKLLLNGDKTLLRRRGKVYKKASLFRWQRGKSIHERPIETSQRERIGDWEVDTVLSNRQSKKVIVTAVDRKSRLLVAKLVENKSAEVVCSAIVDMLTTKTCYTITCDNGTEFANFEKIEKKLHTKVYFAEPFKSWQRGSNENANGLLRDYFKKGSSFEQIIDEQVQKAVQQINNRPCKLFNFRSRFEVYNE